MSKIEASLDKAVTKLVQLKDVAKVRLCALWQQYSPRLNQLKQIDYATAKAFVVQFKWRILLVLIVIYAGSKTYDYLFPASDKAGGPVTVTSVVVEKQDVPLIIEAAGTIVSNNIVDIRPMVTNTVAKIEVKDGQEVKAGDLLFTLDDRNDKANYEKLKALADDAQKQYLRAKELVAKNFISKAGLETTLANAKSAQAAARSAEVQLSFDYIRSPIDGRAGIVNVFPGSLVQASNVVSTSTNSTATSSVGSMVTITQLNPINVQFVIPEKDIPVILENQLDGEAMNVKVTVGDSGKKTYEGKVIVVDNQVDPSIAAVRVKAQIPNDAMTLLPGQFARVSLVANTLKDALSIPSQAVVINPRGKLVYVIDKDGKAVSKPVNVVYEYQGSSVVTGIEAGDRVVVEGKQNLRPGSKIREAKAAPPDPNVPAPITPSSPDKK
ncbi:efflux RND transporter periplasmic adaptor subunit [Polynucleobacter asymbioticus]|uniref:Efflux transporter, RND family, MFP subunit n=1 Tax=Polynucleobacter asymbioticus (strain DSM 18221 / CIP 109841 / QLW-P1DMWA-1) TaxID=312153 RepID=A4SXM7_POLAQ|nr:efflux RND transporter periplasmic adaptor subunit [Polynucleobacter asymbioticus]ABP34241.1 efflux transporter, RND family, MFP subunit [Polynucleobacter asymbioticus QLW-P1DMWA-1]APC06077.1 efflux transporter periplasmic adaptor subunit [Polynucleobacter asymbioticus]